MQTTDTPEVISEPQLSAFTGLSLRLLRRERRAGTARRRYTR